MSSPVHLLNTPSPVPVSSIFTYGKASDPLSQSHDSSAYIVTPKENPTPCNNEPITVTNIPADPYSDPSLSYYSSWDLSDSSDNEYNKLRRGTDNNKKKCRSKTRFGDPIKNEQSLHPRYIQPRTNEKLKLDGDPLQCQFYIPYFIRSLLKNYHNFRKHTCCLWTIHT